MLREQRVAALCVWIGLLFAGRIVAAQDSPAPGVAERLARSARFLSGRSLPDRTTAAAALNAAKRQHQAMLASPRSSILGVAWTSLGPNQVATAEFGNVTGRITAIVIDPADASGNTVYLGTTGGGVWKSTNAAGPADAVRFTPLTDTLPVFDASSSVAPSLSIGSLAITNGVLLAGTGDPNDATDSYYGAGILRSADGGVTWTLAQQSLDGAYGNHSFFGLSVAALAFSSATPSLAVAGLTQAAEGAAVNAENLSASQMGLYYSNDAGVTWHMATVMDGSQVLQSPTANGNNGGGSPVTSVVWNPVRQSFYAAIADHGYYASADGVNWSRLANQPGIGLTTTACPATPGAGNPACPMLRGTLAVQPATGDMFALTVDFSDQDQGLYQDVCALNGTACGNATVSFGTKLNSAPLEQGNGSAAILQGDYNLALAAAASGTDTVLYAGTVDLYRCTLASGCTLRNTTNAQNGCTNPAMVAPAQHALAALPTSGGPLLFVGSDGGLWRSTDGAAESGAPCSLADATHFQNLNAALGSLAEVVSFAQDPAASGTLLAGLGALGTAGTDTVTIPWPQLATGEGGTVAIDPNDSQLWYLSTGAGVNVARCSKGSACVSTDFSATAIGATQVAGDLAEVHAPWLLDPGLTSNLITGTCRGWRGPATGGALWSSANELSRPFAAYAASACQGSLPVVRSLAAGGAIGSSANAQNAGSEVIYAGMAGNFGAGSGVAGHVLVTTAANTASNTTVWTDAGLSSVTNDAADAGVFNPGRFDVSSIAADPHDATGSTVYATAMGFADNGVNAPHVYRSVDAGAHWSNISSNLPNAPANGIVVDPNDANTLYVALDTGVYVTTQVTSCASANCWSVYGSALPNAPVVELAAGAGIATGDGRTGELRAATYGRGIWQIPLLTATSPAAPAMAISPTSVTYPDQQVGAASASVALTVTNTGNAILTVNSVVASGDFNETDTCTGAPVPQNSTCTVQVRFLPTATGPRTGLLTVYGNVAGGQATATLSGIGTVAAAIVLTPVTLAFPSTGIGATSAVQNITVSNTGVNAASLQAPAISGDFTITANSCSSYLAANTGCTLSITFAPAASGTRSGTLTLTDSAGTQVASLSGVGTNPATDALAPSALSFSAQQLNTASAAQQVVLTNAGDVALTLISAQITAGYFSVVNSCGVSLNAHSTCAMSVTFAPKSVGSQTGALMISDQFRSQTVALSGTGLAPPGVSVSPVNGLQFGAVGVGLGSTAQVITLTNNGGVALAIGSVVASGDFALLPGSNTCGSSLSPAAVCTVQIVFTPSVAGSRTGTATFTDNAANSPQIVQLSGTGVDFSLATNGPTSIAITSGQTATYALLLTSAAGLPGSAAFTCSGVPAHAICTVNPSSAALGGTANVSVTVATGLSTAAVDMPPMPWTERLIWAAMLVPFGLMMRRSRRHRVLFVLLLAAVNGCSVGRTVPSETTGGGTSTATTPRGSYTLVVAGSDAGLVRSVNLTMIVQ